MCNTSATGCRNDDTANSGWSHRIACIGCRAGRFLAFSFFSFFFICSATPQTALLTAKRVVAAAAVKKERKCKAGVSLGAAHAQMRPISNHVLSLDVASAVPSPTLQRSKQVCWPLYMHDWLIIPGTTCTELKWSAHTRKQMVTK